MAATARGGVVPGLLGRSIAPRFSTCTLKKENERNGSAAAVAAVAAAAVAATVAAAVCASQWLYRF